jgi:hypothetical protein
MTVRPDYPIEVRRDIFDESDRPMLIHGLQGFHGQPSACRRGSRFDLTRGSWICVTSCSDGRPGRRDPDAILPVIG